MNKIIIVILLLVVEYLMWAFFTLEMNPTLWSEFTRFMFIVVWVGCGLGVGMWHLLEDPYRKKS